MVSTGNQEIPHNLHQERRRYNSWDLDDKGETGGSGGFANVAFSNSALKWESSTQISAGLDFGFLDGRLTGSLDYYSKTTNDLLIQVVSAQPAPSPFVWKNLEASIVNTGIELSLSFKAIDNESLSWDITGNLSQNTNMVKDFAGIINTGQISGQGLSGAYAQRIVNNQPLLAFYVREFDKYNEQGIATYRGGDEQKIHRRRSFSYAYHRFNQLF